MYPIHLAIKKIEDEDVLGRVVKTLLHSGADIKAKDNYGCSSLLIASCYDNKEVVQILQNFRR